VGDGHNQALSYLARHFIRPLFLQLPHWTCVAMVGAFYDYFSLLNSFLKKGKIAPAVCKQVEKRITPPSVSH